MVNTGKCVSFAIAAAAAIMVQSQNALADYENCIQVAREEAVATYMKNTCNQTLHWDFVITGGTDYRGQHCIAGRRGSYTFGANYGPVNLIPTGCSYRHWTCDMRYWNSNGGACN